MSARVFINDTLVGELRPSPESGDSSFEFDSAYASSSSRPVFGRWFEDRIIDPPVAFRGAPLPKYFRNLLPEGALRKIVEKRIGPSDLPEYTMLLRLGDNLSGAVRVVSDELEMGALENVERQGRSARDPFRFALAGVQPKLALSQDDDRLTVPLERSDGQWIAKLGSPAYQRLVENEHLMLEWARSCGLDVPENRIIRAAEIDNFPEDFEPDQEVLIVRRFDRLADGSRVHQEDFAQVFDIAPEERYAWEIADLGWVHYGSIGAVIRELCGVADHVEYMKRLAFMVLSGNGDAHIKNWALVYPDGLRARLAPVYDFVSTVVYPSLFDHSALHWWEPSEPMIEAPKRLVDVTLDDLMATASHAPDAGTSELLDELSDFVADVRSTWPKIEKHMSESNRGRVNAHLKAAALI